MDDFDRRILALVQRDNRLSHARIGHAVGLSESAVRRRLKALRDDGVIIGDVALVDPGRAGVTLIVAVAMHDESTESYRQFKERMRASPVVAQCYAVSGPVDFMLVVHLPDLADYEQWIDDHILADAAVRRCDTYVVYSRVKYSTVVAV